jgi:ParB-like chromosome segregation protein Spo0J
MTKYEQHPLSAAFPSMSADEFESLKDSIESIGVQTPAVLYEGMVIDGWHRYTAAAAVGVNCPTVELGDVDPRDFVLAQNKARRHLTASQRATATAAVYEWRPHGDQRSAAAADRPMTTKQLATIAGVGTRTMENAKAVISKAAPQVQEAVKQGDLSVERAAQIAKLPKRQQGRAMSEPAPVREHSETDEVSALRSQVDDLKARLAEMGANLEDTQADNESMVRVFEADDKVAAALAEARMYRERVRVLEERVRGLMAEKNEAIRAAKSWQRKVNAAAAV